MVFTKPFLYLSVLNFTRRTSRRNRLFRVSKSRNGGPWQREAKSDHGKAVRIAAIISRERFRSARNNSALGLPAFAIQIGGSFTVPLGQVHFNDYNGEER